MELRILQLDATQAIQLANYLNHMVIERGCLGLELELECPEDSNGAYLVNPTDNPDYLF